MGRALRGANVMKVKCLPDPSWAASALKKLLFLVCDLQ